MRSWLYCPANRPGMLINAGVYGADGIVLDLEDATPPSEKAEARILTAGFLRDFDFGGVPAAVRINGLDSPWWREDLELLVAAGVRVIRIPKVETPVQLRRLEGILSDLEERIGRKEPVFLQAILETPRGIQNAPEIADASGRLTGLSFGAEDYCTALGISRTGLEAALDYPRSRVVCAAAAAGLESWDTVWAGFRDPEGLERDARRARDLGFTGKSVIHPGQIGAVNRIFSPTEEEILWAEGILEKAGGTEGIRKNGAFSLNGSMVDRPVLIRAERILRKRGEHA